MGNIWHWRIFHFIPFTDMEIIGAPFGVPTLALYYGAFLFAMLYFTFMYFKTKEQYGNYLYDKFGYILIGGKFNEGKTRLLAQFAHDVHQVPDTFVISNYYNGYSFINFSSFNDFCTILDDLLLLGEYQNFTGEESKKIEERFPAYFSKEELKEVRKFKWIPCDGKRHANFLLEGDEFHQYLYSRNSMSNFSGEKGDKLLQTMHQVRHYNTVCALATQDLDDLDNKLRRLASYEVDTMQWHSLFYGYNFFRYEINKRQTKAEDDARQYRKINKFPVLFLNSYAINFVIEDVERIANAAAAAVVRRWNHVAGKNFIFKKFEWKRFKTLDFETKFNVKLDRDIYKKGDLFRKLNDHYKKLGQ